MEIIRDGIFKRTDIWREGKWLDLWSVVHLLSGISVGLGFYFLHFGTFAPVVLALLSLICYEMWEMHMQIDEAPTNRLMDVVVGMAGFVPAFFLLAPMLSLWAFLSTFGLVLVVNIVTGVIGWRASQKAAALQKRLRLRYLLERQRLLAQKIKLRERFRFRR